jgi:hypothetical protein
MEKYKLISENPSDVTKIKWYIQRKKFWGWRKIHIIENNRSEPLTFGSLGEAEHYMYKHYFREGWVYQPTLNQYWFERNTYGGY